jgi:hypothetical protein
LKLFCFGCPSAVEPAPRRPREEGDIGSNFLERGLRKRGWCALTFPVSWRCVRQVCPKEYEHIRVELPVEGNAVEAVRIDAYQRNFLH